MTPSIEKKMAAKNQIKLYAFPLSPPSRSVHMVLSCLNLKTEYISTNPLNGETKSSEYLQVSLKCQMC